MLKDKILCFIIIILGSMFIFSPIYADKVDQDTSMFLIYDSKKSTDEGIILSDIGVSPQTAFIILGKAGKISLKHTYRVYADKQYYYFIDTFLGIPKKDDDIRKKSVKIRRDKKLITSDIKTS